MHNPFARKCPNPKRTEPRRTGDRVRLRGEKMTELRRQAFERSGGKCEVVVIYPAHDSYGWPMRCGNRITWETMELSHKAHGPHKTDTVKGVLASCAECHQRVHNPKSVPRKPGRRMNKKEAEDHWKGTICCFCKGEKPEKTTFCNNCWCKLSAQSRHDLLNTNCTEDYLQAVAEAEKELLAWEPAEEKVQ